MGLLALCEREAWSAYAACAAAGSWRARQPPSSLHTLKKFLYPCNGAGPAGKGAMAAGNVGLACLLVAAAGAASSAGAGVVFATRACTPRAVACSLGFAAGVML